MGGCISTPEKDKETMNGLESTRRKGVEQARAPTHVRLRKPITTGFRKLVKIIEEEQMRAIAEHEETGTQGEPDNRQTENPFVRRSLRA